MCDITAARKGSLIELKYAHENGCPWSEYTCVFAAEGGHLDCLAYAHENGCEWDKSTCAHTATWGHLDCLTYAHENGCPWDEFTCYFAAAGGHLDCLTYAHENGCEWNVLTCIRAASKGDVDCLKYALDNGCVWDNWKDYKKEFSDRIILCFIQNDAMKLPRRLAKWRISVLITRSIAMYWMEQTAKKGCAEGGDLRKRDQQLFIDEFM
jgi:hypothetical protein